MSGATSATARRRAAISREESEPHGAQAKRRGRAIEQDFITVIAKHRYPEHDQDPPHV